MPQSYWMLDVTILNLVWTVVVSKDTNQIFQKKHVSL